MFIEERVMHLHNHNNLFHFLHDVNNIKNLTKDILLNKCLDLQAALSDSNDSNETDLDGSDTFEEIAVLSVLIKPYWTPLHILQVIFPSELAPNVVITLTLRIMVTLPIIVSSCKRRFSNLKIIRN
jgi:hypothetical protein